MKYKIDFKISFFVCIFIMVFSQIWGFLKDRSEAFPYGDEIYHTIEVIFYVLSNLSIGVAAAIIFYFMALFLDKKKNFDMYTDFRFDALRVLYNHMKILHEIDEFKALNEKDRAKDWFISLDVPIMLGSYYRIVSEEQKKQFKKNLMDYFLNTQEDQLNEIRSQFEKDSSILDIKKETRYFKHSKDLIESFTPMMHEDFGDLELSFSLFINAKTEELRQQYVEELVKDYCAFLKESIVLYEEIETFIETIEEKKILQFIKMVD